MRLVRAELRVDFISFNLLSKLRTLCSQELYVVYLGPKLFFIFNDTRASRERFLRMSRKQFEIET